MSDDWPDKWMDISMMLIAISWFLLVLAIIYELIIK